MLHPIVVVDHFGFIVTIFKIEETEILSWMERTPFCTVSLFGDYVQHLKDGSPRDQSHRQRAHKVCGLLVEDDDSSRWQTMTKMKAVSSWIITQHNKKPDLLPVLYVRFLHPSFETKYALFSSSKMCMSFLLIRLSGFYSTIKPRKWYVSFHHFLCPYQEEWGHFWYCTENKVPNLINREQGERISESIKRGSCKNFGRRSVNSLKICIQKFE